MKNLLLHNAEEINRLHQRIHETVEERNKSDEKHREWKRACEEFHQGYDGLAFPGGLSGAYERILSGEPEAVEAGLSFVECRPYFFRSGYIFKDLLRKLKRAHLNTEQQSRLQAVLEKYAEYKKERQRKEA